MLHLLDRSKQIPNGFTFVQPEIGWMSPKWLSFDALVKAVITARKANAWAVTKYKLSTDMAGVEYDVDLYNASVCHSQGWNGFIRIDEGQPPPKARPLSAARPSLVAVGARLLAGAKTLKELLGGAPVKQDLADKRAIQCSTCPNNDTGDLLSFFTIPAAATIRALLRERTNMGLTTPSDPLLGVCIGCLCPLKLKVHTPLEAIKRHMSEETKAALVPECWVLHEE